MTKDLKLPLSILTESSFSVRDRVLLYYSWTSLDMWNAVGSRTVARIVGSYTPSGALDLTQVCQARRALVKQGALEVKWYYSSGGKPQPAYRRVRVEPLADSLAALSTTRVIDE